MFSKLISISCLLLVYSAELCADPSAALTSIPIKNEIAISAFNTSTYSQLSAEEQKTIADQWHLTTDDYSQYLLLMQNTVNGIYYHDKHLDPSWILGFNAKSDQDRDKYVLVAIQNERARVAKELAFQQAFDRLQHEHYPALKPILTASQ